MNRGLEFKQIKPGGALADFVDSFWMLRNNSDEKMNVTGLPDGRIDLFFSKSEIEPFNVMVLGLNTHPDQAVIASNTLMFAISFKLLACEYILHFPVADLINKARALPEDFWDFNADILEDFDVFCKNAGQKVHSVLPEKIDERKQQLFALIYGTKGEMSVADLSAQVFWSARQINRYFNQQFGISLKAYCSILRFRASLEHIAQGKLFPELNFTDQNHFIKEIKKFSGAVPKELFKNQNDRFILLSAIRQQ